MFRISNFVKVLALVALLGSSAQAGKVLKLTSGQFATKQMESQTALTLSSSTAPTEWIVQFKQNIQKQDRAMLAGMGFEVFGYLPDDALVVRGTQSQINRLKLESNQIEAAIPYAPEYKKSPFFEPLSVFNKDEAQVLVVKTFKAQEAAALASKAQAIDSRVKALQISGKVITFLAPKSAVNSFAALTGVEHVQPNFEMIPMHIRLAMDENGGDANLTPAGGDYTDLAGDETGTRVMNFDSIWSLGYHGEGQIVGMADTGLDNGSIDNIDMDFKGGITAGYAFGMFNKSWSDPMGHGTHVAGSVLGRGVRSNGKIKGGAYAASMVAQGMWSPMMKNLTVPPKLADMLSKAYASGARVHTNSWGAARNFGAYDSFAQQVDEFTFNNQDMIILFAAGNSGVDKDKDGRIDPGSVSSPGTAKNALTVGAGENVTKTGGIQVQISKLKVAKDNWGAEPIYSSYISDNADGIAMFSSRGPTLDGRTKPEIVAPGTNILSNKSHDPDAEALWGKYNDHYVWSGGTSMATPLTAGAAAVTRQYISDKFGVKNPSGALVKAMLLHSAKDVYPGQYGEVGAAKGQEILTPRPNSDEGYGRVDMSILGQLGAQTTKVVDNVQGLADGQEQTIEVRLPANGKFLANLVYTDAPASPNAATALVNDLDLVVTTPDGAVVAPQDRINNNEIVEIKGAKAGVYKVTVKAVKVPQGLNGAQPYALVVSGL